MKEKVEKSRKNDTMYWIRILLFVIFFSVFVYSGYQVLKYFAEAKESEEINEDLINQAVVILPETEASKKDPPSLSKPPESDDETADQTDTGSETAGNGTETAHPVTETETTPYEPEYNPSIPLKVDFDALKAINKDIIAWIYLKDTVINYPVTQAKDNQYYLRRLINGKYNVAGTLFADYRNDPKFIDNNTIIYGHNLKSGSMFSAILKYKKQAFYDSHPTVWILTPERAYRIDLIAGFYTKADSQSYSIHKKTDSFEYYLSTLEEKSTFKSNVDFSSVDRIVTLSTCSEDSGDNRYVLIGSLVPIEY